VPRAGILNMLAKQGRAIRGRRSFTYFAIVDKLAEVLQNRPRLLLELANFQNPYSGSNREETRDIEMKGSLPSDPNSVKSRGVVAKVTKTAAGVHVEFKKISRVEAVVSCKESNRISHIDGNGNIIYRTNCVDTGKTQKVDLTPQPQDVPAEFATGIKPGVFAAIDDGGTVPYVKANADAKSITTFIGYAL
jgi:hypothetical protein